MTTARIEISPANARKAAAELLKLADMVEQSGNPNGYAWGEAVPAYGPDGMTEVKYICRAGMED